MRKSLLSANQFTNIHSENVKKYEANEKNKFRKVVHWGGEERG